MTGAAKTTTSDPRDQRPIAGVDSHAHVFTRFLKSTPDRRYAPDYDATLPDYLAMLDRNALSHGVLVQPSFLGTDNSYLVAAIRQAPDRLRGIVVLEPEVDEPELRTLRQAGCAGIRLNLLGRPDPAFGSPAWDGHLASIAALGWQVEVQAEARRLPAILPFLLDAGVRVVVDHFGLPDAVAGVSDAGFRYLMDTGRTRRVWVKLSGSYRLGEGGRGEEIARAASPLLLASFGADRLLWGTDWPHTQHEGAATAEQARRSLDALVPDAGERRIVLTEAPAALFGFAVPPPTTAIRVGPLDPTLTATS